jgi:hypothetical protein
MRWEYSYIQLTDNMRRKQVWVFSWYLFRGAEENWKASQQLVPQLKWKLNMSLLELACLLDVLQVVNNLLLAGGKIFDGLGICVWVVIVVVKIGFVSIV